MIVAILKLLRIYKGFGMVRNRLKRVFGGYFLKNSALFEVFLLVYLGGLYLFEDSMARQELFYMLLKDREDVCLNHKNFYFYVFGRITVPNKPILSCLIASLIFTLNKLHGYI